MAATRNPLSWLPGILRTGGRATVPVAAAGAGAVGTLYVTSDGKFVDAAGNLIETLNETVGEAQARAGAQIGAETLYATLEQIGIFINNIMGGDSALGFINWARKAQGIDPVVATSDGLAPVTNTQTPEITASPTTDFNATTAAFGDNLRNQIVSSAEFSTSLPTGVDPEGAANAITINRTISTFNPSALIDRMELSAQTPEMRERLGALDSDEFREDFQAIQSTGLEGLTTLFGQMAEGQDTGAALQSTKTLLNIGAAPAPGQ